MKKSQHWPWLVIVLALASTVFLSGCAQATALYAGSSWPGVTTTQDTIYVAFQNQVHALDPDEEGRRALWSFPVEPNNNIRFFAPPAVGEEIIVVADYENVLYGIDRVSGDLIWSVETGRQRAIGGAVIVGDIVYAATQEGRVYALNIDDGTILWDEQVATQSIWARPIVSEDGETLYVNSLDRKMYAISADTGETQWSFPEDEEVLGGMVGTPTLFDGVLYFGSLNNRLYALDIESRELLWSYDTTNWVWSSPTIEPETGLLVGADLDGHVFVLNAENGEPVWTFDAPGPVVGEPTIDTQNGQRVVYVTTDSSEANLEDANLYVFDLETGEETIRPIEIEATFETRFLFLVTGEQTRPIPIFASAIPYGDLLLIGSHTAGTSIIYAYTQDTLTEAWDFGIQ